MSSSILPPRSLPYITNIAAPIFSTFPILIGATALLRPHTGLSILSFPQPQPATPGADKKVILGLVRLFGIRDITLGISTLAIWYFGGARMGGVEGRRALGVVILAGAVLACVDGWVSMEVIGGGEWNHWAFVPIGVGIGSVLMGWL